MMLVYNESYKITADKMLVTGPPSPNCFLYLDKGTVLFPALWKILFLALNLPSYTAKHFCRCLFRRLLSKLYRHGVFSVETVRIDENIFGSDFPDQRK